MKEKSSKLKKQLPNIVLALVFIIGLGIFLYPSVSDFINTWLQNRELSNYTHAVTELSTEEYDKLLEDARNYNSSLVGKNLRQNADNIKNTNYKKLLSLDKKGILGYLTIEKIKVKLPIYHGTDTSALQVGIGHLEGSSLPVDGETVHCVISGHTGLPAAKLLTDLVELKVGDFFRINVLNERYTYKVDQILVVEPNETENLELIEGKQYVTIVTCTPYGVNSHRLLVRGELIENSVESDVAADAVVVDSSIITIILSVVLIIMLFIVMINVRKRKERKERENLENEKENISK